MSSPSLCHGCILLNDLQAVPARHQLLSIITSLGGRYRSTLGLGFHAASRLLTMGGSKHIPDPVLSLGTAKSSRA